MVCDCGLFVCVYLCLCYSCLIVALGRFGLFLWCYDFVNFFLMFDDCISVVGL